MTVTEVMDELKSYSNENTKKIGLKHGAKEPLFGVKVQDLKKIQKKVKKDYQLSLDLYDTGNSDAMYLAGLITDEGKITKKDLNKWVKKAYWYMLSEYTVAWIASESKHGYDLALKWIESDKEGIAAAGWATLSCCSTLKQDEDLDITNYKKLLNRIPKEIDKAPNRVRYTMNGFVIAVGASITGLTKQAMKIAEKIGKVEVNMGSTSCKVPLATESIQKIIDKERVGKKRKTARC
ncbi:DNA alkylation repair protein [Candidatus Uabimicrobium sp. HlEnr_7]|uniref:DNA alkylation repair protein n=1 Tax=Candidatus Uabimicrobium helgolandensis TaxID=3095367 RepID=UPI003558D8C4